MSDLVISDAAFAGFESERYTTTALTPSTRGVNRARGWLIAASATVGLWSLIGAGVWGVIHAMS